jgi:hypothetical protein
VFEHCSINPLSHHGSVNHNNVLYYIVFVHSTSSDPSSPQYGGNGENDDWPVDYSWWATGGFTSSLVPSNTTEIYQHGRWDSAEIEPCDSDILLPEGVGLATQCAVQINAYETAIIGGVDANGKVNNDVSLNYEMHV